MVSTDTKNDEANAEIITKTSPYHTIATSAHHNETISDYSKGVPVELTKHNWFYGEITAEQEEIALSIGKQNNFLVRQLANSLVLSLIIRGWRHQYVIELSPRGYCLEGKDVYFRNVSEMLTHYQKVPIDDKNTQVLGTACDRTSSGMYRGWV